MLVMGSIAVFAEDGTPFVFFFAVNTLKDTSGFFNMFLLIYGVGLQPLCQKPHNKNYIFK